MNQLYYGDNLQVLREHIADESVDLIYLDPPRVQLLTIEGLLSKKQRAEHPDYEPDLNFKKAKTEANAAQKELGV
jgi:hypothetical protein